MTPELQAAIVQAEQSKEFLRKAHRYVFLAAKARTNLEYKVLNDTHHDWLPKFQWEIVPHYHIHDVYLRASFKNEANQDAFNTLLQDMGRSSNTVIYDWDNPLVQINDCVVTYNIQGFLQFKGPTNNMLEIIQSYDLSLDRAQLDEVLQKATDRYLSFRAWLEKVMAQNRLIK